MAEIDEQVERLLLAGVRGTEEIARSLGVSRRRVREAVRRVKERWRRLADDKHELVSEELAALQVMRSMLWRVAFRTESVSEQLQTFKLLLSVNERMFRITQLFEDTPNGETQQLIQQVETLLKLLAANGKAQNAD